MFVLRGLNSQRLFMGQPDIDCYLQMYLIKEMRIFIVGGLFDE